MADTAPDYRTLYEQAQQLLTEKQQQITSLSFELEKLRRYLFGSRSEKLPLRATGANQTELFGLATTAQQQERLSEQAAEKAPKAPAKKREPGKGRMQLPESLRRETIIIEPIEDTTGCVLIGEEVTEVLELTPAQLYVKRYVRRRYARPDGEGVLIGPLPDRAIDKGIPSESVIAQMAVDKYVYGLPLHRQIDKYRRMGGTFRPPRPLTG